MTVRVVLAEDNFLVREGVSKLLETQSDLDLVGVCSDLDSLLETIERERPDVVLTDIRMPPDRSDEGIRAGQYCRREFPEMGVVLLSQYVEPAYVRLLLAQGTERRGYLLKERVADVEDLVIALHEVAKGGSVIDPKVVEALVNVRSSVGPNVLAHLTPRERDVLGSMAQGKNNTAIASSLFLSQRAVEKHINSIFAKLGLSASEQSHPRVRAVLMYLSEDRV